MNYLVFDVTDGNSRLLAEFRTEPEARRYLREFKFRNGGELTVITCPDGAE